MIVQPGFNTFVEKPEPPSLYDSYSLRDVIQVVGHRIRIMNDNIPYDEMDSNIVGLAKVINSFDGIYTISSCGGHKRNKRFQLPAGSWEVTFKLRPARQNSPSVDAWLTLEFLVYLFSKCYGSDKGSVRITPFSPSPYLNGPGNSISFTLEGKGADPDEVAEWLIKVMQQNSF